MSPTADHALPFYKMSGAGNDFVLINAADAAAVPDLGALARDICRRRTSVGADGLVVVTPSERSDADVRVRFWNPDGREFGTCGNGTRCAARFAKLAGLAADEMVIDTSDGHIEARVARSIVALTYRARPEVSLDLVVNRSARPQRGHLVRLGVPHFVVPVETMRDEPIEPLCRPVRFAVELGDAGANVNLVQVIDLHRIRIRTYERGVESETLACGSGSISSAIALCAAGEVESPVEVATRSGDTLTVRFHRRSKLDFDDLELEGPARVIYRGRFYLQDAD